MKKYATVIRFFACITLFLAPMSLIAADPIFKNGAFAEGLQAWETYGMARLFRVESEGGVAWVRYEKKPEDKADNTHLDQKMDFAGERRYTIHFRYRASADLRPVVALTTTNWNQVLVEALAPSADWKEHAFSIITENPATLRLQIFAGAQGKVRQSFDGRSDFTAFRSEEARLENGLHEPLRLDPSAVLRTLPRRLTGVNTLFWLETAEDLADGSIAALLREARVGYLRFPGGTAGQNYDWKEQRVIDAKRYPFGPKPGETWLDSAGFARLVKQADAGSFIVLDLASICIAEPEPSEASLAALVEKGRAWAMHFKKLGMAPSCWELGNEHYLPEKHNPHVQLRVKNYAELCRKFIKAIRSVDADASFGICGPEHGGFAQLGARDADEKTGEPWWPTLLMVVGDDVDRIILHHYFHTTDQAPGRLDFGSDFLDWRREYGAWCRKTGKKEKAFQVGYTEWGGRGYENPKTYALFMHEAMCGFVKSGADFLVEWPLRRFPGDWHNSLLFDGKTPTEGFQVLSAWGRYAAGGELLSVPTLPQFVSASAVKKDGAVHILIGNKSKKIPVELSISLGAWRSGTWSAANMGNAMGEAKVWNGEIRATIPSQALMHLECRGTN